ncbi:MAG TPA: type II secretion system F family protein [Candidatus Nanoarchaeia archaeon]|nr:type II secretion system F family protein [Candidatus Nanoarchaeia archaeon]
MKLELKLKHYVGIVVGALILILDIVLFFDFSKFSPGAWYFSPILVIAILVGGINFFLDVLDENKRQKELELKFLEFVRSLVETVRSGVNIPQAIMHVSNTNLGALTPYVKKLASQLEWGYPLHDALTIFANDTRNEVIKRSVAIVVQAEKSGGDMGSVLEAVTTSVMEIKKVKEERKSNSYTQTVQGYIIFFVFVIIMIVMQVYLIPKLSSIGGEIGQGLGGLGVSAGAGSGSSGVAFGPIFTATIVVQGLFAGLMLGKFAEGDFVSGMKHSLIMVVVGYLLSTTLAGIIESPESAAALFLLIKKEWIFRKK